MLTSIKPLKSLTTEAYNSAKQQNAKKFKELDNILNNYITIYSQQISQGSVECSKILKMQMDNIKYISISTITVSFLYIIIFALSFMYADDMIQIGIKLTISIFYGIFLWEKIKNIVAMMRDNRDITRHTQDIRRAISNSIICLEHLNSYKEAVSPMIEKMEFHGLLDDNSDSTYNTTKEDKANK